MSAATVHWFRLPWLLLWAIPLASIIAGLSTVGIAFTHQDDMVVDAYYKQGLAYNVRQEADRNAHAAGLKAQWVTVNNHIVLTLQGVENDRALQTLQLTFAHPTDQDKDQAVRLQRVSAFQFEGELSAPINARAYTELRPETSAVSDDAVNRDAATLPAWRLRGVSNAHGVNLLTPDPMQ